MANKAAEVDYRELLEQERSSLGRQLDELGFDGSAINGLAYDSNFADSSHATAEREEAETLAGQLRAALENVERALSRLDQGTYGICERCGQPIVPARLEAKPAVTTCIACAHLQR